MRRSERGRAVLFAAVCAVLLGSALAFQLDAGDLRARPGPPRAAREPTEPARVRVAPAHRPQSPWREVQMEARSFLAAFLRYEVGELGPRVRRALRVHATARFAARLLAAPPPLLAGAPPAARLGRVRLEFATLGGVLISATARRGGRPEQLSFLFIRRDGVWLASGAGQ
jgi:hypothetical protein